MNPEYIGYAASAFVAISFLLKEINKIRFVNLIGCLLFVVYGSLIDSIPVIITNVLISIFQIYYLFLAKKQ
ncbi:YgjV family protein [Riemerella columbina]|uniref:YgjV family protein n=1 Tax=Riemerella columbina TaxID=103810 RepID=UPI00037E5384|nr:YgjV family protein [Riemerella columbina]